MGHGHTIARLYLQSFLKVEQNCKESFRSARPGVRRDAYVPRCIVINEEDHRPVGKDVAPGIHCD